jgi:hypothetical protein
VSGKQGQAEKPVTDALLRRAPRTVADIVALPISSADIEVERQLVGHQVRSRYVRKSDGTPVAGLSETWHLMGVEGGFDPPPS